MSFIKQLNDYTCSPVCLYNIGMWLGQPKLFELLKLDCNTDKHGTTEEDFELMLKSKFYGLKITRITHKGLNFARIRNHLQKPNAAIAVTCYETWETKGEIHDSLWLSEDLSINLKGDVYCKEYSIANILWNLDKLDEDFVIKTTIFLHQRSAVDLKRQSI